MNEYQARVLQYMDAKISGLKTGAKNLEERQNQPNELGNLYNGILKHNIAFEITNMENLKEELYQVLESFPNGQ